MLHSNFQNCTILSAPHFLFASAALRWLSEAPETTRTAKVNEPLVSVNSTIDLNR